MKHKTMKKVFFILVCLATCIYTSNTFSQCLSGYEDGFETPENYGFWQNLSDDDFNWTRKSGPTTSTLTGPSAANEGNFYLYTESSSPNYGNKVARVSVYDQTVPTNLSGFEISFDYHMYGSSMGSLALIAYEYGNLSNPIYLWQMNDNQGDIWFNTIINLDAFIGSNLQLVFEGTTANSYRSDMALDNIRMTECTNNICNLPPVASFSFINNDPTLTFVPGSVIGDTFVWDFGDGNFQTQTLADLSNTLPTHTYATDGTYTVCMTAQKNGCPSDQTCQNVTIGNVCNLPPVASFSFINNDPTLTFVPGSVIGDTFVWDFGDGTSQTQTIDQLANTLPVHTYATDGTYTVCMTAQKNGCPSDQTCQNVTISNVCNLPPVASFSFINNDPTLTFVPGSVIGDTFVWDFGDGTSQTQTINQLANTLPVHTYATNGTYTVCMTAQKNGCPSDQTCQNVTINNNSIGAGSCLNTYLEGFESVNQSGWQNLQNDDIDWIVNSGGTPSGSTGPSNAIEGNNYLYVETSGSNSGGKSALVYVHAQYLSPNLSSATFNFDYHMYGSGMGTLNLIALVNGSPTTIWTLSGNQGDNWHQASVDLSAFIGTNIELQFEAITGPNYRSDMAIDNFTFDDCIANSSCNSTPISDFTFVSNNDPSFLFVPGSVIGDTFIWNFGIGNTLTQNGSQLANNPPTYTYPANGNYTVCLTSIIDGCPTQDVSCQNITVNNVNSWGCTNAQPIPFYESYENGIGLFTQNTNDDMNWTQKSGGTPSYSTGPNSAQDGNHYIYVEASGNANKTASITSPCFDLSGTNAPEFSFQRNMRGAHMGSLSLDFYGNGQWFNDVMVLTSTTPTNGDWEGIGGSIYDLEPGMLNCNDCKIRLKATVGTSYQSDICVDKFELFDSSTNRLASNNIDQVIADLADFTLFPNPATANVNLNFEEMDQVEEVLVSNLVGQSLSVDYDSSNDKMISLDISNLKPGYYMVTVVYNFGKSKTKKLIVK